MTQQLLIAGGGLGGLATALACSRAGWQVRLYEQASVFSEVGAGIQLGPNSTRLLHGWGLAAELERICAAPARLVVRSATDGAELASMGLGRDFETRYGAPYATVHRADLHDVLLAAARQGGAALTLSARVEAVTQTDGAVTLGTQGRQVEGGALIGADGLWSMVRSLVVDDGPPRPAGHLAWRALAPSQALPAELRIGDVNVWLGPALHAVAYPVRGGDFLNVVVVVQGRRAGDPKQWDHSGKREELMSALGPVCSGLWHLVEAMPRWGLWVLHDRPPMRGPQEMARGRIALLGDAAHPMRPYLAQGAGMAIEDAAELGRVLATGDAGVDVPAALVRYASNRWQRCARVQSRSQRNGRIFHATGPVSWGRNLALRVAGERLLDLPWLYR